MMKKNDDMTSGASISPMNDESIAQVSGGSFTTGQESFMTFCRACQKWTSGKHDTCSCGSTDVLYKRV